MHSGLIIDEEQGFLCKCLVSCMSSTKAVENVLEDIVTHLKSDALQPMVIVGLFVKYSI